MKFYTATEVANMLKVHRYTVYRWINEGKLKAFQHKENAKYLISEEELKKYLNAGD